ncbi:glutamate-5-semialdehyde dehydrogenase [Oceanobacillus indicireducens]|uniref:Gamma-glutamyl phosphate reductase n=1 Tax=Oceanobacillus indicireducens TaxID=1004261 RepID=A0A918D184_9BACI|nr:glutamate-5-semialdehyde dehydrogenase [Oceanobacillus indicireducens]GGN57346.1 gamma-glutamyl phosphate reductase [Oceanobacillus indicireducens]
MSEVIQKGKAAKKASYAMSSATTEEKNEALSLIAAQLLNDQDMILKENEKDLTAGRESGLTSSVLDRIMLNQERLEGIAAAIEEIIVLHDPIGEILETIHKDNGMKIEEKRVPLGVVAMIYEARPNVTVDAATLTLKTGNAVILRGSSSAKNSNLALVNSIHRAMEKSKLPVDAVQLIEDTSRETASELFRLNDYLDVLIPRGGKNLIDTVVREATVPVIETGAGNCHVFIDQTAKQPMAEVIVLNSKLQRPSVCNAIESLLIDASWFAEYGKELLEKLKVNDVQIYADERVREDFPDVLEASEEDWANEYLGHAISVKVVDSPQEAIEHINQYGTKHSEAIITEDARNAEMFLQHVDAAAVYHNVSTRFTDGFEFGYGAEIGISTQKLHARGPMGLKALTSSKVRITGDGQVRS